MGVHNKEKKKMKIIFLDIDGVLNTVRGTLETRKRWNVLPSLKHSGHTRFDAMAVQNLNELCRISGARIVLSSCWKYTYYNYKQMMRSIRFAQELMDEQRITGKVIGVTPTINRGREWHGKSIGRGREIRLWLMRHKKQYKITRYVILDDDSDFLQHQKSHHVKTKYDGEGLDWKSVLLALKILRQCRSFPKLERKKNESK